jgi:hypothetical protein
MDGKHLVLTHECGGAGGSHGAVSRGWKVAGKADHDGLRTWFSDALGGFNSVEIGEPDVHQDHIGLVFDSHCHSLLAVSGLAYDSNVFVFFKDVLKELARPWIIVDKEHTVLDWHGINRRCRHWRTSGSQAIVEARIAVYCEHNDLSLRITITSVWQAQGAVTFLYLLSLIKRSIMNAA